MTIGIKAAKILSQDGIASVLCLYTIVLRGVGQVTYARDKNQRVRDVFGYRTD